jgi:hypothetical protein
MLKAIDSDKLQQAFWSGILLGISFLMKQPGIFFVLFGFSYFLLSRLRRSALRLFIKQGSLFLLGAVIPFVLTCVVLYRAGVFEKFWFWTFSYALEYGSQVSILRGIEFFFIQLANVIGRFYLAWSIAGMGIIALFWDKTVRTRITFILGFLVSSFIAICPGLYFRPHYFVFFLPATALLIGIAIRSFKGLIVKFQPKFQYLSTILFLVALTLGVVEYGSFFFKLTPLEACRRMYSLNPFPESIEIAKYIKANSGEGDKIAVLGSEPQICFYANRHSATGYIYTYPLMEDQKYAFKMQKEMTEEIERARPRYLVFVNVPTSWLVQKKSERYILSWFKEYGQGRFDLVGIIDILSDTRTEYRWGSEAASYSPRSPYFLCVYRRRAADD